MRILLPHTGIPILEPVLMHTPRATGVYAHRTAKYYFVFTCAHVCMFTTKHTLRRIYNRELQKWKFPVWCASRKRNARSYPFFRPFYSRKNTRDDIARYRLHIFKRSELNFSVPYFKLGLLSLMFTFAQRNFADMWDHIEATEFILNYKLQSKGKCANIFYIYI